jgi:CBS domain-containing protein
VGETVRDVMTGDPVTLPANAPVSEAAKLMREHDVGSVIVLKASGKLCGVVTDRDIVVRAIGEKRDPWTTQMDEICSHYDLLTVSPDTPVDEALELLRDKAVRRLPVVENDRVVGVVSMGDLALARERGSALADVSAAPANR